MREKKLAFEASFIILIFQKLRGYELYGGGGGPLRLIESLTRWDKRGVDSRHKLKQYHGLYSKFRGRPRGLDSRFSQIIRCH